MTSFCHADMADAPKFDLLKADFRKPAVAAPKDECGNCCGAKPERFDFILWGSAIIVVSAILIHHLWIGSPRWLEIFSETCVKLASMSWWALVGGIIAMAVLSQMPREIVAQLLGRPGTWNGILRATAAGLLLDLCNHGILMVAMGLYKRGASLGQTMAFLIASPWNSLSMTLLLAALIGVKWAIIFVLLSALIGMSTGWLVELLTKRGAIPRNIHTLSNKTQPSAEMMIALWRGFFRSLAPRPDNILRLLKIGLRDSRMVFRWIMLGFVITAAVKAFVPHDWFQNSFGPTIAGLLLTLLATTVIEVCSEGSSPLAAEIFHSAKAPGNAFTFLMAGAATDYTEILSLKSTTGRWICALILPLLTVPQVLIMGWLLNQ